MRHIHDDSIDILKDGGGKVSYKPLSKCRICGNTYLKYVFDLGYQALANDFVKDGEIRQGYYPLKVLFCSQCSLSQLSVTVDPAILYSNYKYVTSASATMEDHFGRLISEFKDENAFNKGVIEIGSNDGAFLDAMSPCTTHGVIGIDPAANLARGHSIVKMFNRESAMEALDVLSGYPSLIVARHCVAHMDDLKGFVDALTVIGGPNTLIAIEIPYMRDTLNRTEFDQVYHEHCNFISLHSLEYLLKHSPFHIHRVIHYAIHGGTILIMLRHGGSQIEPTISEYVREDKTTLEDWHRFGIRASQKIGAMQETVFSRSQYGKTICGFGASAKASVWIQRCGFTNKDLSFVTDNSPLKPGCLIPGSDIPVVHQNELLNRNPQYAVLFAWNFREAAFDATQEWRKGGGRFIIPTKDGVEIV